MSYENPGPTVSATASEYAPSLEPLVLRADNGITLKQMTTIEDDRILFQAQNANSEHIARFGNRIYESLGDITEARLSSSRIKFGIWKSDEFIGTQSFVPRENGREAEVGTWLVEGATGHGYAASARKTLSRYLSTIFERVYAETDVRNTKAIKSLQLSGYQCTGENVLRKWGNAVIYEFVG
jgi:RimJ/RimL family protein N-acetyltransferase